MDYREQQFRQKFDEAAKTLSTTPDNLVSIKLRENVGSHDDYQRLATMLEQEARLSCKRIPGNFQGQGYLVRDGKQKIIFVEHETGLEILTVASGVASVVSVIPVVIQAWRWIRGRMDRHHDHDAHDIEVRRLDRSGKLIEERSPMAPAFLASPIGFRTAISSLSAMMRSEVQMLTADVRRLEARVETLEKQKHKPAKRR